MTDAVGAPLSEGPESERFMPTIRHDGLPGPSRWFTDALHQHRQRTIDGAIAVLSCLRTDCEGSDDE